MINDQRVCILADYPLISYQDAWNKQKLLVQEKINQPNLPDILMLLEHPPVYTLGTGANADFIKFDLKNTTREVHRVERGGEVTYHCPGQIVGYPILDLHYYQQDLHWYLRQLEEVIIRLLHIYHLDAHLLSPLTGVWVDGYKVAAIGIKVKRWITMHGFALNVCPDLQGFELIIPCGIKDKPVGSMAQFIPDINLERVKQDLIQVFAEVFQVSIINQKSRINA